VDIEGGGRADRALADPTAADHKGDFQFTMLVRLVVCLKGALSARTETRTKGRAQRGCLGEGRVYLKRTLRAVLCCCVAAAARRVFLQVVPCLYLLFVARFGRRWGNNGRGHARCEPGFPTWMLVQGCIGIAMPFVVHTFHAEARAAAANAKRSASAPLSPPLPPPRGCRGLWASPGSAARQAASAGAFGCLFCACVGWYIYGQVRGEAAKRACRAARGSRPCTVRRFRVHGSSASFVETFAMVFETDVCRLLL
jgi:hypothetical protein